MSKFRYVRVLFLRLSIAFAFFTICRILFYVFNAKFFHSAGIGHFFSGVLFDVAAICMYFSPFILLSLSAPALGKLGKWYHRITNWVFHLANALCISLNTLDFEFFKFTSKRTTCDFFSMMSYGDDAKNLIPSMLQKYWFIALSGITLIVISIWIYNKTRKAWENSMQQLPSWSTSAIVFVVMGGVFFMGARMSVGVRPLNLINGADFSEPENIPLVLNTPFTIIKTINEPALPVPEYFSASQDKEMRTYFDPVHTITPFDTSGNKPNIIVFIIESFSREYFGSLTGKKTYTPFLDSLMSQSLVFENSFANGKRSIEATPVIVSSLPTLMDNPFISSSFSNNKLASVATELKKMGYANSFFHGATNGSMAFDVFTHHVGFEKYVGRKEFGNDEHHDGTWGIYDEEFFQFMADHLDKEKEPFVSVHFTLTSHSPYPLPERYKKVFTGGPTPMHNCVRYTDYSFKKFFDRVKNAPWFKNTIFVFTADHTSDSDDPYYASAFGRYRVPLFIYSGDGKFKGNDQRIVQQLDIFPTVLSLAGYQGKIKSYGKSVFHDDYRFSIQYVNGVYQLIDTSHVLQYNGQEVQGFFNWKKDPLLQSNLYAKQKQVADRKLKYLQAVLQQYFHSLQFNKLTVE